MRLENQRLGERLAERERRWEEKQRRWERAEGEIRGQYEGRVKALEQEIYRLA